jgi:POT family proton-dependent oligopeptide transporter
MTTLAAKSGQKMPSGTTALIFVQLFSLISFATIYSTLAIYCSQGLHLDDHFTTSLIAMFLAFNYGLHLLGGYVGGRFLSYRSLFIISMLSIAIGCYLITTPTLHGFYSGIAFFLTGAGLNVTCLNCMVTQLFQPDDKRRETAFLWNYSSMNLGFFMANIIAGYFQLHSNYRDLFLLSGLGNLIAIVLVACNWSALKDIQTAYQISTNKIPRVCFGLTLIVALFCVLYRLVEHPAASQNLVIYSTLAVFAILLVLSFSEKDIISRQKMHAYLIFCLAAITFWTIALLVPNGLALFLERNVDRQIFNFTIPPQWFFDINPFMIMLGAPPLAALFQWLRRKGYKVTLTQQFSAALFLMGAGLLVIPLGIAFANENGYVPAAWITAGYALQGTGELFLGPIGYAMVGQLAPARLRGVMMGTWMMVTGMSGAITGIVSKWATYSTTGDLSPIATNYTYGRVFIYLGLISVLVAVILFRLRPLLDRLIREPGIQVDRDKDITISKTVVTAS